VLIARSKGYASYAWMTTGHVNWWCFSWPRFPEKILELVIEDHPISRIQESLNSIII
jgi:hypothetical protein